LKRNPNNKTMTLNTNSKLIRSLSEQFNLKKTLLCAVAILGLASSALAQCDGSLSVSIQSTEATCGQANAALTSTVSGGTEPYAYAWNNSSSDANQSNLSAGVYSLTVTDNNGCTASASATVASVSCPVVATQSITNVIQNAATVNWSSVDCAVKYRIIVINVNTQVQQIYFTLAPATSFTIPNLEPNTPYTVRIRTQCTETGASVSKASATMSFSTPPCDGLLSLSTTTVTDATCGQANGIVNLTVTNGVSPFDYNWSSTQTTQDLNGVGEGTYAVTVTDDLSCTVAGSFTVNNTGASTSSSTSITICENELPFVFEGQEYTSAGTYEVTIPNIFGCDSVITLNLNINGGPVLTAITGLTTLCPGTTTTYTTDDIPGATYSWSYSANWITNSGETTNSVNVTAVDTTFVTVIVSNGCASDTLSIFVNSTCPKPTGVTTSAVDATSATIQWDSADCNQEYQVQLKQVGTGIWNIFNAGTSTSFTFSGLDPLKNYQYKVINICSNLTGSPILYGPVYPFTTPDVNGCSFPQNITATNISATSALISWSAQASLSYRLRVRPVGTTAWTNYNLPGSLTSITVTGLTPATVYEYQLRAECSANAFTPNSPLQNFTSGALRVDEDASYLNSTVVYPNPAKDQVNISLYADQDGEALITISDITGRQIISEMRNLNAGVNITSFQTADLSAGIYMVNVMVNGKQQTTKFVKE